nr:MAG TPA: hypothetical protein [Caudoviricetes sp.]
MLVTLIKVRYARYAHYVNFNMLYLLRSSIEEGATV